MVEIGSSIKMQVILTKIYKRAVAVIIPVSLVARLHPRYSTPAGIGGLSVVWLHISDIDRYPVFLCLCD